MKQDIMLICFQTESLNELQNVLVQFGMGRLLSRIEHKDLTIDPMRWIVTMQGELVALSPKEFDILHLLAQHAGNVLTPKIII